MPMLLIAFLLLGFSLFAYAESETQTDWSGSTGVYGPVPTWGSDFYSDSGAWSYTDPSELSLQHAEHTIDEDCLMANSVNSMDVNGDNFIDVLGSGINDITWWENMDGSGTCWTEHPIGGGYGIASTITADINGDGFMDALSANAWGNSIRWWENLDGSGLNWSSHSVAESWNGANSVHSADVNSDGYLDVLGTASQEDEITWWENIDGSGIGWAEHTIDGDFDGASSVYTADINSDGYLDVLGAAVQDDNITWWENVDGSGTIWLEHIVSDDFDGAKSVYSSDVNGDGYMDLLGAAWIADDITLWLNLDGSGTNWTELTINGDFNAPSSIQTTDVNGDGYMDVLGGAYNADIVTWWENIDGSGINWVEHTVNRNVNGPNSVCSADVNGDGCMDILAAAYWGNQIAWWDLVSYSTEGTLESSCLYVGIDPGWGYLDWTAEEPASTGISFQVRSCDSPDISGMGAWSDTLHTPCSLDGLLAEGTSYFQYKAILQTSDTSFTPVLDDITVTWNPSGVEETEGYSLGLLPFTPNPSSSPQVKFYLPEAVCVRFSIYNLSGRLVIGVSEAEYPAGFGMLILSELNPGIYFCRMNSGDFTTTRQFVVIE